LAAAADALGIDFLEREQIIDSSHTVPGTVMGQILSEQKQ
jgi:hypothetical protein